MTGPRAWTRDLGMGVRLAAGGRTGAVRTVLNAAGLALGVLVLLVAASVPAMVDRHADRVAARSEPAASDAGPGTLSVVGADREYRGQTVRGRLLAPDGDRPPLPPGVAAIPGPGEVVVSPELRRVLHSSGLLELRFAGREIVGTIGDAGLSGPRELAFYEGADSLERYGSDVRHVDHFGGIGYSGFGGMDPGLMLLVLVALVVLLLPVAVFAATAARFGGDRRDQRLAAVRLAGADAAAVRRIAAGEALPAALGGLAAGAGVFALLRQAAGLVSVQGTSVFPADVVPHPLFAALVAVAVPVTSLAVTLVAMRRVTVEPLGVVREAAGTRRRLWPRLPMPVVGLLLLAPVGAVEGVRFVAGLAFVLVGVVLLLPWLVEAGVARLHGGPLGWQLAARRLQLTSGAAARAVSAVTVAVAGAIVLQMMLAGGEEEYAVRADPAAADLTVTARPADYAGAEALGTALRGTSGVRRADVETSVTLRGVEGLPEARVAVADCATLRGTCHDGDVFISTPYREHVEPGQRILLQGTAGRVPFRVPADARLTDAAGFGDPVLFVTPGALDLRPLALRTTAGLRLDPDARDAGRDATEAALRIDPTANVSSERLPEFREDFADVRTAVLTAAIALLLVVGGGVLITVADQLREARRSLAVLDAFGARRPVLAVSVLLQTAFPLAIGLLLAAATGVGLGTLLVHLSDLPVRLDPTPLLTLAGTGAAIPLLVTALTLPALGRLMRPEGLRTE
ncbi:hypothetical protein SRB5_36030 [Streptomyces sp. RB5]|uniref:ABC3 transporter permease C-terminal domain-containing protein n=1 Tax=Streptomyces smaragdinus TaxID=2585196 RepID=A0A7K0CIZ6_9ACTN|nr:FtsX-like permease family protein [Streptomyces smaragdinus]MQY13455.1 hypothetical protein [Streptomyces smaragdinus]